MPIVYWCCAIDYPHCQKLYRILERAPFPLIVYKDLHMSCKFLNLCKYFSIYRKNVRMSHFPPVENDFNLAVIFFSHKGTTGLAPFGFYSCS
jgi:hypothetical protein